MSAPIPHETEAATEITLRDQVLWVQLRRPEVLNAINAAMVEGLHEALDRAERCSEVRAVVLYGSGRAFCAGVDLHQVPGESIDIAMMERTVAEVAAVIERLARLPKPVIAGVNGTAAAGGLEIVLACDLIVAVHGARLADAHSNYGLLPGGGGSFRLPRLVGVPLAKRLMFTGEFVPVEDLVPSGLVTAVVEPEVFEETLQRLAGDLAERSPRVLAAMKRLVDDGVAGSADQATEAEAAELSRYLRTPDLIEGLTAFREGRRPQFDD